MRIIPRRLQPGLGAQSPWPREFAPPPVAPGQSVSGASMPGLRARVAGISVGGLVLRILVAAGLAVDAFVHADLAPIYDGVRASVSEGACSGLSPWQRPLPR
jgi:hypothetical protein